MSIGFILDLCSKVSVQCVCVCPPSKHTAYLPCQEQTLKVRKASYLSKLPTGEGMPIPRLKCYLEMLLSPGLGLLYVWETGRECSVMLKKPLLNSTVIQ